ncbi:MAG TPA: ATP-binding protein [Streptomyces sp.]|nr:ATP-binding protein [Streptomyces sp.]
MKRLLPWTGEAGQPAFLSADGDNSFVSRLADGLESVQLDMAEQMLQSADSAWTARSSDTDLTSMVPHLCHALRDAVRVARSLRERLSAPDYDERSAGADAALVREIATHRTKEPSNCSPPSAICDGPSVAAYRWPARPESVGAARRALRRHLGQWGLSTLADTAGLVLSELATNAQRHACKGDDRLIETRYELLPHDTLRMEVHDADEVRPQCKEPSSDSDSGRGLLLVDSLTGGNWGVSRRKGPGKLVWAHISDTTTETAR